jgi:hypothetical protein
VVGTYYVGYSGPSHGFIYDGASFTTIDAPGAVGNQLTGISGGPLVGYGYDGTYHGFIYNGGAFTLLKRSRLGRNPRSGHLRRHGRL